jgi:hypothetical protein
MLTDALRIAAGTGMPLIRLLVHPEVRSLEHLASLR